MRKDKYKYSIQLIFTEYQDNGNLTSIELQNYFELTTAKYIEEVSGFFHENLKLYLEKHNIIKND